MESNKIDANIRCPNCSGQLFPRVLVCDACGLKVEGEFVVNEFGSLTPDELHFVRVFIQREGRIRDMEAALGVSYPTVKAHLASIKQKLNLTPASDGRSKRPETAEIGRSRSERAADPGESGSKARSDVPGAQSADIAAVGENDLDRLTNEELLARLQSGEASYKDVIRVLRNRGKDGINGN